MIGKGSAAPPAPLEIDQIQGLILNGYRHHTSARYALFEIVDRAQARKWLGGLVGHLQFGDYRRSPREQPPFIRSVCVNVAFTWPGFLSATLV